MTKDEITTKLTDAGIPHDPAAPKADLAALLPVSPAAETPVVVPEPTERELRWSAFLAQARKVNPTRFDQQEANGEFKTIPDSFA